jgi:glycosyltransferase involved in cell wall biosynthesis
MEFMAVGVPVLATRTRIDEFYFNDRLVQFFESGNAPEMADKIIELIESPQRMAELRRNCSEFIAANNWNEKQEEYFALVDSLIGKSAAAELVTRS